MTGLVSYGTDRVKFRDFEPDPAAEPDELGVQPQREVDTVVPGCHHRAIVAQAAGGAGMVLAEYPEPGVQVATQYWQTTCPAHPAALTSRGDDVIEVNGEPFQIVGDVNVFNDGRGQPIKVTIISERQSVAG